MEAKLMKCIVLSGHNKCGTRWLAKVINGLTDVHFVGQKEVRKFFETNDVSFIDRLRGSAKTVFIDWPYCVQNPEALDFLYKSDQNMEAMIIYREPVDAMVSFHRYQRGSYKNGFLRVAGQELPIVNKIRDSNLHEELKSGLLRQQFEILFQYDLNLAAITSRFVKVHEFLYEDLTKDNNAFIKRVCDILNCTQPFALPESRVNKAVKVRSELFHDIMCKSIAWITGIDSKLFVDAYKDNRMRKSLAFYLFSMNWSESYPLSDLQVLDLKKSYSGMVECFAKVTSCNLSAWGEEYTLNWPVNENKH
jgi:hypothetical protein